MDDLVLDAIVRLHEALGTDARYAAMVEEDAAAEGAERPAGEAEPAEGRGDRRRNFCS